MVPPDPAPAEHGKFLKLLLQHERALLSYIRTMIPSRADAEDVLQEATVTLWEKFGEFEPGTDFRAWAFRVAYWKVRQARQKAARSKLVFDDDVVALVADAAERAAPDGDRRHEALAHCLGRLSERDRTLVLARYESDGGVGRAAELTGRSVQATYKALGRAKQALRDCVRDRMEVPA